MSLKKIAGSLKKDDGRGLKLKKFTPAVVTHAVAEYELPELPQQVINLSPVINIRTPEIGLKSIIKIENRIRPTPVTVNVPEQVVKNVINVPEQGERISKKETPIVVNVNATLKMPKRVKRTHKDVHRDERTGRVTGVTDTETEETIE